MTILTWQRPDEADHVGHALYDPRLQFFVLQT